MDALFVSLPDIVLHIAEPMVVNWVMEEKKIKDYKRMKIQKGVTPMIGTDVITILKNRDVEEEEIREITTTSEKSTILVKQKDIKYKTKFPLNNKLFDMVKTTQMMTNTMKQQALVSFINENSQVKKQILTMSSTGDKTSKTLSTDFHLDKDTLVAMAKILSIITTKKNIKDLFAEVYDKIKDFLKD